MLARTLISDRSGDLRVRLLNLNEHPERLPVGLDHGELERVLALEPSLEERGTASEPNHVEPLLETVDPSVPVEQRQELANLLHRFFDVFSKGEDDLGCTSFVQHCVDTGNSRPFRQQLRRHPDRYVEAIDDQVKTFLRQGLIRPCRSE